MLDLAIPIFDVSHPWFDFDDAVWQEHTKEELDSWKIIRVSEDFRVIALGLPVPKYKGNPLDPPLRSRFQARDIYNLPFRVSPSSCTLLRPARDGYNYLTYNTNTADTANPALPNLLCTKDHLASITGSYTRPVVQQVCK